MLKLILQDVTPELMEELRRRAEPRGRTVEAEARSILEEALGLSKTHAREAARQLRERLAGRVSGDSVDLIRPGRRW